MKAILHTAALFFGLMLAAEAQQRTVSGTVSDMQTDEALPGVSIRIKGTSQGATTDFDGNYRIQVQSSDTLVFSYVGFLPEEVPVADRSTIDVTMSEDIETLSEVVVVGYGQQQKKLVTGAISSVDAEEIKNQSVSRVEQAMQGRMAGVNVNPGSGSPGSGLGVIIRGVGTNGNSQPLYVVDGIQVGGIEYLDPNEIESIDVLKDAASAAVYGVAAGNGVVLITTKSGAKNQFQVRYDGQYVVQSVGDLPDMMTARQYQEYLTEAGVAGGPAPSDVTDEVGTRWFDEVFENAPQQQHALQFSGGNDKSTYFISGNYFTQDGIVGGDKASFDRITARVNSDHQLKPWLRVGETFSYINIDRTAIAENTEFGSLIGSALALDPLTPVTYADGNYPAHMQAAIAAGHPLVINENGNYFGISNYLRGEFGNPFAQLAVAKGGLSQDKVVGNAYVEVAPFENFKFTTRYSIDATFQREHYWTPTYWYSTESQNSVATGADWQNNWKTTLWENFANYDIEKGDHNISLLAGMSARTDSWNYLGGTYSGLFREQDKFSYADGTPNDLDRIGSNANTTTLASAFGRVIYDFKDKYLLTAIVRRDGSSKLAPGNRWRTFPSVSVGWLLSEESFFPASDVFSLAKLRAGYGKNGNINSVGAGQYLATIATGGRQYPDALGNYLVGAAPGFIPFEGLEWESVNMTNIGLDLAFFNNRFTLTAEYYEKETENLLTLGVLPDYAGNDIGFVNAGNVVNKGFELELVFRNQTASGLNYNISGNLSTLDNEVTYLNPLSGEIAGAGVGTGWVATKMNEGLPIWYFSGYKTDGIFQSQEEIDQYVSQNELSGYSPQPGDPRVLDVNNDNQISPADQTFIGSPHPDLLFGATINLEYKGFDFTGFIQGSVGQEILMGFNRLDRPTANKPEFFYTNRWTGEGSTNEWFRADASNPYIYNSDLMVFDGSFARIRQLQLGYTLPNNLLETAGLKRTRFYVSLDNYFTFTKYPGVDPETGFGNSIGIDRGTYPIPRRIVTGLSITF